MEKTAGLFMNDTWQTVYLLNASHPVGEIQTDTDGNPIAFISFPTSKILYGENITYQIAYRIILKSRSLPPISENQSGTLNEINGELKEKYCRAKGPWQVEQDELRDLAFKIAGNETNVLVLLKKFILWIKSNIDYESQDLPKYPIETIKSKKGDCDDQANLLITFCRIIGIPAYLQIGCIYLPQRESENIIWEGHWMLRLTKMGWHGWAVVYVPPWGWIPVDLTYVPRILSDPLSAIREAAIITHATVQYSNVIETDYIASSRSYREFLLSNGFKIYEHDAMFEEIEKYSERDNLRLPRFYAFICLSVSSSNIVKATGIREDLIRKS
ncbi:TPA: transglutaminase domain-containing protein [Candidatus Bathyarchaeota archaeon]|nr:transglutaminase domain-containing protein [Candidatus Bathyarchaeota archaeon]